MAYTLKLAAVDCAEGEFIEIKTNANVTTSEFINGILALDSSTSCIDLTLGGHQNMTKTQLCRFYSIWEFLSSPEGEEYRTKCNVDYWQFRNFRADDCLEGPLKDYLKFTPEERPLIIEDLLKVTLVSQEDIETNEHTKAFLEKGYLSGELLKKLLNYANYIGDSKNMCIQLLAGCFVNYLKRLVKVFNPDLGKSDGGKPAIESGSAGFVEETLISTDSAASASSAAATASSSTPSTTTTTSDATPSVTTSASDATATTATTATTSESVIAMDTSETMPSETTVVEETVVAMDTSTETVTANETVSTNDSELTPESNVAQMSTV